jgi:hypothetical protein
MKHFYEPPVAHHRHNTPCKQCGKTARHSNHHGAPMKAKKQKPNAQHAAAIAAKIAALDAKLLSDKPKPGYLKRVAGGYCEDSVAGILASWRKL